MASKATQAGSETAGAPGRKPRTRKRFEKKREDILDAATVLINEHGAKGSTLQAVAGAVGLNTTSVTYYFRRKELLAAAVFERTIARMAEIAEEAAREPTPQERVHRFLLRHINLRADVIRGDQLPLATLSDLRTLDDELREPLQQSYQQVFRTVRDFFGPVGGEQKPVQTARAHILLETVFWLPVWISRYPIDEFPRVLRRLFDILENGIALPDATWSPIALPPGADGEKPMEDGDGEASAASFLRVATRLINESGYRGASVVRIVEELQVTKGSFYHHLDAKDDLVLECFRRSHRRISNVQRQAAEAGSTEWEHMETAMAALLDIQFAGNWPLTRTSALQALPPEVRADVVARSDRTAVRFAGLLIEGAAHGTMRLVDPMIASQTIIAMLNSAYDLRKWATQQDRDDAIRLYASPLVRGLFADPAI